MNFNFDTKMIEGNVDKIGMLMGYTNVFGLETPAVVWERAQRVFHLPHLGAMRYFAFEHADTKEILIDGAKYYAIGWILEQLGGSWKRVGRVVKQFGKGIAIGGALWILTLSTHFKYASPLTPNTDPNYRTNGTETNNRLIQNIYV